MGSGTSESNGIEPARLVLDTSGTPWSPRYEDVYHSRAGGLEQAREVFIAGNRLPERWAGCEAFTILETGFGLGTNFLATWEAWRADPQRPRCLHYVSIEESPFAAEDLLAWHSGAGTPAALVAALARRLPEPVAGLHRIALDEERVTLILALGDVERLIGRLRARVDAFYLDGFAPSCNPRMWSPAVLRGTARLAAAGATLATYTVARGVAEGLTQAGFRVAQLPGFGGKRAKLTGVFDPRYKARRRGPPAWDSRTAAVVGAGIAGVSTAEALLRRGWTVHLIEAAGAVAAAASGVPAGAFHPVIARDDSLLARLTRAGFLHTRGRLQQLAPAGSGWWDACGHLHCMRSTEDEERAEAAVAALRLPRSFARYVNADEAAEIAGARVARGGYWFPGAGWMHAGSYCRAMLAHRRGDRLQLQPARVAGTLVRRDGGWLVCDGEGVPLVNAAVIVLAAGSKLGALSGQLVAGPHGADPLALSAVRGQMTGIPAARVGGPRVVVSGEGYCLPALDETVWCGATYDPCSSDAAARDADHHDNLDRLKRMLPELDLRPDACGPGAPGCKAHVGFRAVTPDRLPVVGALPSAQAWESEALRVHGAHLVDVPREEGVFVCGGLASRGLAWAGIGGETIAALVAGEPLPLEADVLDAVDPARFLLHALRRSGRRRQGG